MLDNNSNVGTNDNQGNEDSIQSNSNVNYERGYYYVHGKEDERAYFYVEPDYNARRGQFIPSGLEINIDNVLDGFGHTAYISPNGETVYGWIEMTELNFLRAN